MIRFCMRVFCVLRLKCILDLPATSAAPGLLTVASFGLAIMNNVAERPLNGDERVLGIENLEWRFWLPLMCAWGFEGRNDE